MAWSMTLLSVTSPVKLWSISVHPIPFHFHGRYLYNWNTPNRCCPFICTIKQVPNFQCFLRGFLPSFFGKNVLISIQHRLLIFSPGGWPWGTRHRTLDAHGLQSHFRMDGRATAWQPNLPTKPPNCLAKKDRFTRRPGSKMIDINGY